MDSGQWTTGGGQQQPAAYSGSDMPTGSKGNTNSNNKSNNKSQPVLQQQQEQQQEQQEQTFVGQQAIHFVTWEKLHGMRCQTMRLATAARRLPTGDWAPFVP
ncbi:hypothetical protein AWZ03_002233 [Drosophila navojoa]|uniref:Uncharacterized protein n=1 Tax=Drosophila navojoa TaxID=7232 RepID=A0A484BRN5_DRONA|nr:hypothetical protein AWZ03_002233 [Drosophila navojoa]